MEKTIYVVVEDEDESFDDATKHDSLNDVTNNYSLEELSDLVVYEFELKSKGKIVTTFVPGPEKKAK